MRLQDIAKLVAGAGFCGIILVGCSPAESPTTASPVASDVPVTQGAADPNKPKIIIGTTEGDFADMVRHQVEAELNAMGYEVELKTFTDYVIPNQALADGDLDINIFQHKPYLDNFKAEHNLDLVEVFQVPTAPLGIYPGNKTSLTDAAFGMRVAVPNDPSNLARALVMMEELGWITLTPGVDPLTASVADIADNSLYNIDLVELEAPQLPLARTEVDFAVINGNFATDSGIAITSALHQEQSFAYVNWSAVRSSDLGAKWVQDVTAAYNSDSFKNYAHATFPGYKYPAIWADTAAGVDNALPAQGVPATATNPVDPMDVHHAQTPSATH